MYSLIMQKKACTLAIDMISPVPSISLFLGEQEIELWSGDKKEKTSESILINMLYLLEKHKLRLDDIYRIISTVGPGSLTSIRVCLATIKGLKSARKFEVMGVDNLALLAIYAFFKYPEINKVKAIIEVSENNFISQNFVRATAGTLEFVRDDDSVLVSSERVLEQAKNTDKIVSYSSFIHVKNEKLIKLSLFSGKLVLADAALSSYLPIAAHIASSDLTPFYASDVTFRKNE